MGFPSFASCEAFQERELLMGTNFLFTGLEKLNDDIYLNLITLKKFSMAIPTFLDLIHEPTKDPPRTQRNSHTPPHPLKPTLLYVTIIQRITFHRPLNNQ